MIGLLYLLAILALISGIVILCLIITGVFSNDEINGLLIFIACICLVVSPIFLADLNNGIETQEFYNTEYDIERLAEDNQAKRVKADEYMLRHGHYLWFDYWELDDPNCERTSTPQPSEDNSYKDYLRETA